MRLRDIFDILPPNFRRQGIRIILSIPLRALLDLIGVAALIPILMLVLEAENIPTESILGRLKSWSGIQSPDTFTWFVCMGILFVVVVKNVLNLSLSSWQNRYLLVFYRYFSHLLFIRLYQRGLLFIKGKNSAELSHSINYVCYAFAIYLLSPLLHIAGEGMLLLLLFIALLLYNPLIALLMPLCFVPAVWLYTRLVRQRLRRLGEAENRAKQHQTRIVQEAFRGYAELEVNQAFPYMERQFMQELDNISAGREKIEVIHRIPAYLIETGVVGGMVLLIILLGAEESLRMSFGIFAVATLRMLPAVRTLVNGWTQVRNHLYCLDLIREGIADPENQNLTALPLPFQRSIEVRNLSFAFSTIPLFSNLSFTIRKGERLGIRGASGVGKSTLFNLLLGFYPPAAGNIVVDDHVLTPDDRRSWLAHVGYVPQDVFILDSSLAENIALGVLPEHIDRKKLQQVLEQVQLSKFVEGLPEGTNTHLGENGCRLSGGQRQRIGIARALYKEADVLLFDEATSSLDLQTEEEINRSIRELSERHRELTLIVIAHRESSLAFCDRIIDIHS